MTKTFILGLGAPKSGTTWLFNNLQEQSWFQRAFVKELHIWDGLYIPESEGFRKDVQRRAQEWMQKDFSEWHFKPAFKLLSFYTEPENYFDYFDRLVSREGKSVSADLTPAYAGLADVDLMRIRQGFEKRGIRVVVVFLMREPVSRHMSNARMRIRKKDWGFEKDTVLELMQKRLDNSRELRLNNYIRTHKNAVKVFGEENCFFGFYETLFTPSEIERMARLLDVPQFKVDFEKKYNASPMVDGFTPEELQPFRDAFEDRYHYVRDMFGDEIIELWEQSYQSLITAEANV